MWFHVCSDSSENWSHYVMTVPVFSPGRNQLPLDSNKETIGNTTVTKRTGSKNISLNNQPKRCKFKYITAKSVCLSVRGVFFNFAGPYFNTDLLSSYRIPI